MMYVVIAVFVVVIAAALVVLLGMLIGAFSAMFTGMRDDLRHRRSAARSTTKASSTAGSGTSSSDPLADLADTTRLAQARRWALCKAIRQQLGDDAGAAVDSDAEGADFVALAVDLWHGRSIEDVEGSGTGVSALSRRRSHGRGELERFSSDPVGQIAWTTAAVADRISALPAWRLDFFDRHAVRVDLEGEVTAISTIAVGLRDQLALLGAEPAGHLATDPQVVSTFVEKSLLLSGRLDELVRRLEAFAGYESIVARIQQRQEKQAWLDRVSGIDDFEHAVATEWDRAEGDRVRHMADESDVLASIYLDEIAPLAKSLTRD
ncbi:MULTISPECIES: hypothetical protein [unclassified Gordonia (in: high G+C Gram-positive bacteria)]|uniref:hypothetical protein n=1 Tax=unclassified Gordonia (in: high G+C Gram-positive bacteria) TaxID=2657482 RepID=UPI0009911452|nr:MULTISPECIES: hypothetical protein [unclassified Gordonia (in: high G+C Gram-positive bacteria)]MCX2754181.1 hypothetical protein [Gordonia sp. 4N]